MYCNTAISGGGDPKLSSTTLRCPIIAVPSVDKQNVDNGVDNVDNG